MGDVTFGGNVCLIFIYIYLFLSLFINYVLKKGVGQCANVDTIDVWLRETKVMQQHNSNSRIFFYK